MVVRKVPAIILILVIFLSILPITQAFEDGPSIDIYNISRKPFTVKVYIYPEDLDLNGRLPFTCPYHDKIVQTFYEELLVFRKAVFRFVAEHPEYSKLARIEFVNVSSPEEADVTLRVTKGTNESGVLMYRIGSDKPNEIQIDCWYPPRTGEDFPSIMLHEIFHALGIGHAGQQYTSKGEPELMYFISGKTYPSTLDLYALHELYFGEIKFDDNYKTSITLPEDLEYKMVVPYDVELQQLREENQKLRSDLSDVQVRLDRLNDVINRLTNENKALKQQVSVLKKSVESLEEQLGQSEAVKSNLEQQLAQAQNEILKLQDEVSRLQEDAIALQALNNKLQTENDLLTSENQSLRQQLQQANQMIQALAILAICLTAITLVMITVKRRG